MGRLTMARHGSGGGAKATKDAPGMTASSLPGAINMGFTDGHASSTQLRTFWNLYWHAQWTPSAVPPLSSLTAN
jgi:prepilin-type processing-associated H-X9-DG protein